VIGTVVTFLSRKKIYLVLLAALLLAGCAAKPRIHSAPDPAKMNAAARRLSDAIDTSSQTAERAAVHIEAAQKAAAVEAAASATVVNLVNELAGLVPPELREKVTELQGSLERQQSATGEIVTHVAGAQQEHEQLRVENKATLEAKKDLETRQAQYVTDAGKLAIVATKSDQARYDAQSQLIKEKIFKWVFRIGGGALVLLVIVLLVTGKLSWSVIKGYFGKR